MRWIFVIDRITNFFNFTIDLKWWSSHQSRTETSQTSKHLFNTFRLKREFSGWYFLSVEQRELRTYLFIQQLRFRVNKFLEENSTVKDCDVCCEHIRKIQPRLSRALPNCNKFIEIASTNAWSCLLSILFHFIYAMRTLNKKRKHISHMKLCFCYRKTTEFQTSRQNIIWNSHNAIWYLPFALEVAMAINAVDLVNIWITIVAFISWHPIVKHAHRTAFKRADTKSIFLETMNFVVKYVTICEKWIHRRKEFQLFRKWLNSNIMWYVEFSESIVIMFYSYLMISFVDSSTVHSSVHIFDSISMSAFPFLI